MKTMQAELVLHVRISVGATSSGAVEYRLMKYSGGTQSAVNTAFVVVTHAGPFDSNDAASTVITAGLAGVYTANPASSGTGVGIVDDWTSRPSWRTRRSCSSTPARAPRSASRCAA
jgi:hypothetical protein